MCWNFRLKESYNIGSLSLIKLAINKSSLANMQGLFLYLLFYDFHNFSLSPLSNLYKVNSFLVRISKGDNSF